MENYFVIYVIFRGRVLFEVFFYLVYDYSGSGYYNLDVLLVVLLNFFTKLEENYETKCFCGRGVARKVRENEFCKIYKFCFLCFRAF